VAALFTEAAIKRRTDLAHYPGLGDVAAGRMAPLVPESLGYLIVFENILDKIIDRAANHAAARGIPSLRLSAVTLGVDDLSPSGGLQSSRHVVTGLLDRCRVRRHFKQFNC